jgi:hypothetical protein
MHAIHSIKTQNLKEPFKREGFKTLSRVGGHQLIACRRWGAFISNRIIPLHITAIPNIFHPCRFKAGPELAEKGKVNGEDKIGDVQEAKMLCGPCRVSDQ